MPQPQIHPLPGHLIVVIRLCVNVLYDIRKRGGIVVPVHGGAVGVWDSGCY